MVHCLSFLTTNAMKEECDYVFLLMLLPSNWKSPKQPFEFVLIIIFMHLAFLKCVKKKKKKKKKERCQRK